MTKTELVTMITSKSNLTKKESETVLNAFIESVTETMKKGDKIGLVGFGTFSKNKRNNRNSCNNGSDI